MRTVRASELAIFVYCHRAWWYQARGVVPEGIDDREAGIGYHHLHGSHVRLWRWMRVASLALFILGLWLYFTH